MQVGPAWWRCVTTDEIGVPYGGAYGDVRRAEAELNRVGMKLCWSYLHHCFGIYTEPVPNYWRFQLLLQKNGDEPIPLTDQLVWTLYFIREEDARMDGPTIEARIRQIQQERKNRERAYAEADARYRILTMEREVPKDIGEVSRATIVQLPGKPLPKLARQARRRRRRRRQTLQV